MGDVFGEMGEPSEPRVGKDGRTKKSGVMFCPKPAANSLSLSIHAMRVNDAALQHEIDFVEVAVDGEFIGAAKAPATQESDELCAARADLSNLYLAYESIAEALGPETPDIFSRFNAVCDSEGLPRISVADYR